MSCDCVKEVYSKGGTIVLTKNDLYKIRNNKVLDFHFHGLQFGNSTITFFVTNKKNLVEKDSHLGREALRMGEVCPIIIDELEMKILRDGDQILNRILPTDPPYKIVVCSSEQWHKQAMEQKKKEEEYNGN